MLATPRLIVLALMAMVTCLVMKGLVIILLALLV